MNQFPPVPKWRPSFSMPIGKVAERFHYYFNNKRDFALFENATCAIVANGLDDAQATAAAQEILHKIYYAHPDLTPQPMDDGNLTVRYAQPAANVVLTEVAKAHWAEIEARYMDGLATAEVIFTPLGQNVFDDLGKKALLGRCYMFMDAQAPKVVRIERAKP